MARSPSKSTTPTDRAAVLKPLSSSTKHFAGGGDPLPRQAFSVTGSLTGRAAEFFEYVEPKRDARELVLSPVVSRALFDVVQEFRNGNEIRRHGLPLRTRLLFCGPPGCGKTVTAEIMARETGLPFLVAKLDTLIGPLLGETATNLRRIFDAAERQASVLFLDEFDALARTRSDPSEHNEMRRVVNNLLLMIERFKGKGFIVAATNLETTIDPAIVRRFDEVVFFNKPSASDIRRVIRNKTKNFPAEFDIGSRANDLIGQSHADVERICFTAMRRAVMEKRKSISWENFDYAVDTDRRRHFIQDKASQ